MPISCACLADSKMVRVMMKVMIESKNYDDFCGGSSGAAAADKKALAKPSIILMSFYICQQDLVAASSSFTPL